MKCRNENHCVGSPCRAPYYFHATIPEGENKGKIKEKGFLKCIAGEKRKCNWHK